MTQEAREFIVLRTIFVSVAVLICVAIGALFSTYWAVGLGVAQFVISMTVTRERVAFTERHPDEPLNTALEA